MKNRENPLSHLLFLPTEGNLKKIEGFTSKENSLAARNYYSLLSFSLRRKEHSSCQLTRRRPRESPPLRHEASRIQSGREHSFYSHKSSHILGSWSDENLHIHHRLTKIKRERNYTDLKSKLKFFKLNRWTSFLGKRYYIGLDIFPLQVCRALSGTTCVSYRITFDLLHINRVSPLGRRSA